MTDPKKKKPMSALDYINSQPAMQGRDLTPHTQNKYSALAEYPPLSYSKAVAVTPPASSSKLPPTKSAYITKTNAQHLMSTSFTKQVTLKELQSFTNSIFYTTSQWMTDNTVKDRMFYEYILVDTNSVEVTHYPDKSNPDLISYSTCKIKGIYSIKDLGFIHQHTIKHFSTQGYHLPGFSYVDYTQAFFNMFYLRPYDHSWFISFDPNCAKKIPGWFYEWWHWFGPMDQLYPETITKVSYPYYKKNIAKHPIEAVSKIGFHIDMGIPWILSWHFNITSYLPGMPLSLTREFRLKWWDKYNQDRCSAANQEKWLQTHTYLQQAVQQVSRSLPLAITQPSPQRQETQQVSKKTSPAHSTASSASRKKQDKKEKFKKLIQSLMTSSDEEEEAPVQLTQTQPYHEEDPFGGPLGQDPFEE